MSLRATLAVLLAGLLLLAGGAGLVLKLFPGDEASADPPPALAVGESGAPGETPENSDAPGVSPVSGDSAVLGDGPGSVSPVAAPAGAVPPGPPPLPTAVAELRAQVDRTLDQGWYRRATWGVLAVSLDRGDTLLARNAELPMLPASNLKVLTSAAALHYLGPDYRFPTWALTDAPVVDGVVLGDVVLYGTGDPGIAARYHRNRYIPLRELAQTLKDAGIRRIQGRVLGDGTFFQGPLLGEGWEPGDLNEWFTAPSGALSFNENVASVRVRPGTPGEPPELLTIPEHVGLLMANEARTVSGRARRPLWLLRDTPSAPIRVTGELSVGARDVWRQMTVRDPALAAAHAFTHTLREWEIRVDGYPGSVSRTGASLVTSGRVWTAGRSPRILAEFRSPPLSEYLTAVNQRSHNLYADMILKTLGRLEGEDGSFAGGAAVLARYLRDVVGVDPKGLNLEDGSGLSSLDRIRPADLVATLAHTYRSPAWNSLWESLPEAGARSMFRRMSRTAAAGNLRAKTGTMDSVSGLTGMVRTADGERVVFSILGNDLPSEQGAKRLEDRVGRLLAEWRR